MSRSALARVAEAAPAARAASALKVSQPTDSFEVEADRVADTVVNGGRVPGWTLGAAGAGSIQRQPVPDSPAAAAVPPRDAANDRATAPAATNKDLAPKLAEALMATSAGQAVIQRVESDPLVKGAERGLETPAGIVIAGATAVGAVGALAATHQALPLQIPAIPLDRWVPGLSVKLDYRGPVDRPTSASLSLRFSAPRAHDKKKDASSTYRAETARIAADQAQFRAGLHDPPASADVGPAQVHDRLLPRRARPSELWAGTVFEQRLRAREPGSTDAAPAAPMATTAGATAAAGAGTVAPAAEPVVAPALQKPTPATPTAPAATILRKIDPGSRGPVADPRVDGALQSSGRPLDGETRAYMESRIGFDFGSVQVHTDGRAAESAQALGAKAYTVGSDVVFAEGQYAPRTTDGRRLIAHELTHVVQQSGAPAADHASAGRASRGVQRSVSLGSFSRFADKVIGWLQKIPGYPLFTMILGKDPLTGKEVQADPTALVGAILELMPGGTDAFQKLKQNNAIERAVAWIRAEIGKLEFTEAYFDGLLQQVVDGLSVSDAWNPGEAIARIAGILRPPFERVKTFAGNVFDKVFQFVMDAALEAIGGQQIIETLHKAGAAIGIIAKDPAAFLQHLLDALKQGFNQFTGNIVEHLKAGLVEWLFGEVKVPGLAIPKTFSLASIGGMVLQVLGITWANFRRSLVEALGEPAVAFLEKSLDVIKTLAGPGGLTAAWGMIVNTASDLLDTVMGKVRDWVVGQIVKLAVPKIVALFNPVAGLIESIRVIYDTIKFFIEKAKQIAALVKSIVDSLSEIAHGNIEKAANWIEQTMAKTIPLILRFLAGFLHLDGIGDAIRGVIDAIRAKVKAAFDKVVGVLVGKGRAAWDSAKDTVATAAGNVAEWWRQRKKFKLGEENHEMFLEGSGDHPEVMVESAKSTLQKFLDESVVATPAQKKELLALAAKIEWRKEEVTAKDKAGNDGAANFELLLQKIGALKSMGGAQLGDSVIKHDKLHAFGGGVRTDAFLTLNHPIGTEPDDSSDPPIWTDLGSLRQSRRYIRGHLLSQRLGGQGEWKNMMPITNKANQQMYHKVEKQIISAISTGKTAVHFVIDAGYKNAPKNPGSEAAAEARLDNLSWTVKPAQLSGSWKDAPGKAKTKEGDDIDTTGSVVPTA